MWKLLTIKGFLISAFSLFIIMNNVFAKECYEKSPNLVQLKDDYFKFTPNIKISDKDRVLLNELYKNIKGQWKGSILHTACKGPDKAPTKTLKEVDATVEFYTTNNYLVINSKRFKDDRSIGKQRKLRLLGDEGLFNFKFINNNSLVFTEILFKKNATSGTRLLESLYELELNGDKITFTIVDYVNGVFVFDEKWSLTRD